MTPCEPACHADYPEQLRTFTRQRQDWLYVPLEKSPRIFISRTDLIATVVLLICFVAAFAVPSAIVHFTNH